MRYLNNYVLCPHQCSTSYTMLKKNYETSTDRIYSLTSSFFYPPPLLQFKVAWFGTFYLIHSFLSEYSVTSVQSNSILHRHIQYSTDHYKYIPFYIRYQNNDSLQHVYNYLPLPLHFLHKPCRPHTMKVTIHLNICTDLCVHITSANQPPNSTIMEFSVGLQYTPVMPTLS